MEQNQINICYRIKEFRRELNMSQSEFGKKIEVAQSYLTNIETAKRPVTEKIFKLICLQSWNGYFVNENWLRTGEGNIFQDLPFENETAATISNVLEDIGCDNTIYTLVKEALLKYERLDPKSKEIVENYIDDVLSGMIEKREEK